MGKDSVNVLMVCGYGLGSSAISEVVVGKALKEAGIRANLKHTALGEMTSFKGWVDIIAISKKLTQGLDPIPGVHMIPIINVMDGKTIANQIREVVEQYYPDAQTSQQPSAAR